ncbi:YqaI family protein [Mangrovibacillus cuniculi]|uniref:Uncharacterized protein n=1 Tax=Mangrovibacillus cuniculi TaxID=2593652 RepID=A0A7S8HGZ5_9BACI|nr:hypothetical protein [Mangrovibacillus cuniculi]QPC47135.1 hypothetical protein G8O30_09230 [Mangrovibacillus cuniculi]QPC48514.1 hypothetical protein G8O30_16035 [Mangrovibacillus cuniculi]
MDHPVVKNLESIGHASLEDFKNESVGNDYFGNEIMFGDEIVLDPMTGGTVLRESLSEYLEEQYGFAFREAK